VLGTPVSSWDALEKRKGVASINGITVGEGIGAEAMGHPFDAVAWIAAHLSLRGHGLLRNDIIITGSLVTSKRVKAGDRARFDLEGLGCAELMIE
jgi:2-keto-4-pentenoate hydratase